MESLYKNLANKDVCWTKARGGCWLAPNELIFPDTHTARNSGLMEALVAIQIPLCTMPNDIATMLLAFTVSVINKTMLEHRLGDNASGCRAMSIALIRQDFLCCMCGILTASHIMGFFLPFVAYLQPFSFQPNGIVVYGNMCIMSRTVEESHVLMDATKRESFQCLDC